MFRKRLRKPTGCLRCRLRHVKCDEQRPRCSFCQKWGLDCSWPPFARRPGEATSDMTCTNTTGQIERGHGAQRTTRNPAWVHQPSIDHYGQLTLSIPGGRPKMRGLDELLCLRMIDICMPFDNVADQKTITTNFIQWAIADEALYCAFVAWCEGLSENQISHLIRPHMRLELQHRTVSALRQRVESGASVTEATILAAAFHFMTMSKKASAQVLHTISGGIYTMVESRGGFRLFSLEFKNNTTTFMLWGFDSFMSILDARSPTFTVDFMQQRPESFDEIYQEAEQAQDLCHLLGPDILCAIRSIRFLLYFRHPSKQSRPLTAHEAWYMRFMILYSGAQLGELQRQFFAERSISEVTVAAILIIHFEVIGEPLLYSILIGTILQRLSEAISLSVPKYGTPSQKVKLWALFVAMAGNDFETVRNSFMQPALSILDDMYGPRPWPTHWRDDIQKEFEAICWHTQLDVAFFKTCDVMETTLSEALTITNSMDEIRSDNNGPGLI